MAERFEQYALRLAERDNVAVARRMVPAGISLNGSISLVAAKEIPAGHKIAVMAIGLDEAVMKYGQVIGYARSRIEPGEHVHTHNVRMRDDADERTHLAHECCVDFRPVNFYPPEMMRTFQGYERANGNV